MNYIFILEKFKEDLLDIAAHAYFNNDIEREKLNKELDKLIIEINETKEFLEKK